MLRLLILTALMALTLAHGGDHDSTSHEAGVKKGHCPNHGISGNASLPDCPASCANGTDCAALNCTSDTSCAGSLKCCETSCGFKCIDFIYDKFCNTDADCGGTLACCRNRCKSVCVTPRPVITSKKGKDIKGKHK
ncbi:multiple epidermal growth factor-like domains 11 isoform X2 [Pelobates cultripes]|uniref:Multiple epidermal growth factor-like domains 11 isoform X2 n=1 Tax=Pelobates cultripes TaxID=61616 RepID=A0AAD1WUD6_PELCU|nr:multiple epidermal growth factor-like domains 11 isoform X2 [Pelobates cultripes]